MPTHFHANTVVVADEEDTAYSSLIHEAKWLQ
jgi:hypothetical protein